MNNKKICLMGICITTILITAQLSVAKEIDANEIMKKMFSNYKNMKTCVSKGKIINKILRDEGEIKTETIFSMKLGRPNLYYISWSREISSTTCSANNGALWNSGEGPYLYAGKSYTKQKDEKIAFAFATGVSQGLVLNIPCLFLYGESREGMGTLPQIKDIVFVRMEVIEGENCYVLTGKSQMSGNQTIWVSKERLLCLKYESLFDKTSMEKASSLKLTDEQIEETIKNMGLKVTNEAKANMRETLEKVQKSITNSNFKAITTEIHYKIITNSKLNKKDFEYVVPEGTVLKESLMEGLMGSKK